MKQFILEAVKKFVESWPTTAVRESAKTEIFSTQSIVFFFLNPTTYPLVDKFSSDHRPRVVSYSILNSQK